MSFTTFTVTRSGNSVSPRDGRSSPRPYSKGKPMPRVGCRVDGCDRIADIPTAELCRGHYGQQHRGEMLRPLKTQRTPEQWLLAHRSLDPDTGCWLWTRGLDTTGYGQFHMAGQMHRCHRIAYELWVGPINGDTVHHKCAVRRCFNPEHLELATIRENALEMHERRALRNRIAVLERRVAELEGLLWPSPV